jgi:hypothetical protein
MTTRYVRWNPDTCSCVLEYSWDDTQDLNTQTFPVSNIINTCSNHSTLTNAGDIYTSIKDENTRKNRALQYILDNGPASLYDLADDGVTRILKSGLTFNFNVSGTPPNRVVTVSFSGVNITANQKQIAQNFCDNHFGIGKVVIQ